MSDDKNIKDAVHEKRHYETLISLYKYSAGAIVVLVGIGAYIIGSNISDIKADFNDSLKEFKIQINEMKHDSKEAIKSLNEESDKQIENLRKNNELFLSLTKDITEMQIAAIREDAKNLALSSARLKIEEVFKENDIQKLVDSTAKSVIAKKLEIVVKNEIQRTTSFLDNYAILTTLYDRIRAGDRASFNKLDSIAKFSLDPRISNIAKRFLDEKTIDYEESLYNEEDWGVNRKKYQYIFDAIDSKKTNLDTLNITEGLIDLINNSDNLNDVAWAYKQIRKFTGKQIKMFDIEAVNKLKK